MKLLIKFNSLILALFPALAVYLILPGTTLAAFLSLLIIPIFIVCYPKRSFSGRGNELFWFISIILIGFLGYVANINESWFSLSLYVNNLYSIVISFLVIIISTRYVSIGCFIKTNLFLGIIASIVCVAQRIVIFVTGISYVDVFIPGLPLIRDIDTFTLNRPSSFFTEPAHLSIFLLPIAYYLLLWKKYLYLALISLAIIASGSSTGFILLILVYLYYLFTAEVKRKYVFGFILGLVVVFVIISISFPELISDNINKLSNVDASSNVRLLGALDYLSMFNFKNTIVGLGLNQLADYLYVNGVFPEDNPNYANAFLYMLISYGLLGLITFIMYLYKLWKSNLKARGFFLILLGVIFSDQILFNQNLIYLITFILLSKDIEEYLK